MSSVVISGDSSGTITLAAPSVAGSTILTLPATTGTVITTTGGVTPSTVGNVLTSDGTNWTSAAPSVGAFTSLGTITLSGTGNQFSLGSLTLTSYRYLYCVFRGVGSTATFNISISNATGDQTNITGSSATGPAYFYGSLYIDLTTGIPNSSGSSASGLITTTSSSTTLPVPLATTFISSYSWYGPTAIGTAITTIYLYITGAGTKAGTINIYGVK
jgi:hypothetical protein